jgi:hypothetical protein
MCDQGRGTQRQEEQQEELRNRRKEREASSSREEETLRNDQRTSLQCRSDQERQAKDGSERNHSNTKKWAGVGYSDVNHLAPRSKKPRMETTKGGEAGVSGPEGVAAVQKTYKDDEDGDQQGFKQSLCQPCSEGDTAADARTQNLEQELHTLEDELKNENQVLREEDKKLHADAVHATTREATARASGTYRVRWTTLV